MTVKSERGDVGAQPSRPSPSTETRLVDLAVGLIADHGLDGATFRRLAAAAGLSVGAVQHHFRSKEDLLAAAMDRLGEQMRHSLRPRADLPPADLVRVFAHALTDASDDGRRAGLVWLAFAGRAAVHPPTRGKYEQLWAGIESELGRLLGAGERAGLLLATLDGLALAFVLEPARMPADRLRVLVDAAVDAALRETRQGGAP